VLGSPRSGTTLLYDMLLSAGGFAVYLAESNVFNLLAPRFGDLNLRESRQRLVSAWLGSKLFRASGLDRQSIAKKLVEECSNAGEFLRIVMGEIARAQGVERWAENSPEGMLYLPLIKQLIPDALVIHIIRDGRDVAMSLGRVRYVRPFPWEERQSLIAAGVYWEWMVQHGRRYGCLLATDYMELHFESLIAAPQECLNQVGAFIGQELDYGRIQEVAYGSVSKPNTSFRTEASGDGFNPVGRWKKGFPPQQLQRLEKMIGKTLLETGYGLSDGSTQVEMGLGARATRSIHRTYFEAKFWFKRNSVVRALRPALTSHEIDETVLAEDHPPDIKTKTASHEICSPIHPGEFPEPDRHA
jgi:hypothetical protein